MLKNVVCVCLGLALIMASDLIARPTWAQQHEMDRLLQVVCVCLGLALIMASDLIARPAWAQQYEMDRLLQTALQRNPSVASAKAQAQGAIADMDTARWQRWPTVSATGLTLNGSAGVVLSTDHPGVALSVSQPLWTGGELTARIRSSEAMAQAAETQVNVAGIQIALRMLEAWQSMISAHYRLLAQESALREYDRYREMMKRRVEAKVSPGVDMELLLTRTMDASSEANNSRVIEQVSRSRLELLAGISLTDVQFAGLMESVPNELLRQWADSSALERLLKKVPGYTSVLKAQFEADAARQNIAVAQAQLLPHLSARYDWQRGGTYTPTNLFSLSVTFQPGAGLSSVSQLRAQKARAEGYQLAVDAVKQDLSESLRIDWANLKQNLARAEVQGMIVLSASEVLASYERQFIAGRKSWLDVLNALRELTQYQVNMADSNAGAASAYYRLRCRSDDLLPTETRYRKEDQAKQETPDTRETQDEKENQRL